MTNGEKILNAFPNATTRVCKNKGFTYIEVEQDDEWIADYNIEWWNSEYKESVICDNAFKEELEKPRKGHWIPLGNYDD